MNHTAITCELVDERDLDTRYLAGTLAEAEAEAFEAHYFECERCWALVRCGSEVRGALAGTAVGSQSEAGTPPVRLGGARRHRRGDMRWLGLAAALVCVAAGLSLWRALRARPDDTVRGGSGVLPLAAVMRGDSIFAAWPRVPGAASYRLRLFTQDGALLLERELADTALAVPTSLLPDGTRPDRILAQAQAEDELRHPLARSRLQPVTSAPHQ